MNKKTFIKGTLIVLVLIALGYALMRLDAVSTRLFRAQLIEGTSASSLWNPLLTDTPCKDAVAGSAEQELWAQGADDWKLVTPAVPLDQNGQPKPEWYHKVLSDGGPATYELFGVGDKITFKAPKQVMNGEDLPVNHFQVMALPAGAVDGGEIFDIYLDPVCVTQIEILDPVPGKTLLPTTSQIEINKIKVSLSNGVDYVYSDPTLINNMELSFLRNGEPVPSGVIPLPAEHGSLSLLMEAGGSENLSPSSTHLIPGLAEEPDLDKNVLRSSPILVAEKSCQDFQIAFIEGEGQGFFFGDPGDTLPEPAVSRAFAFDETSQSAAGARADVIDFSALPPAVATSDPVDFNTPVPSVATANPIDFSGGVTGITQVVFKNLKDSSTTGGSGMLGRKPFTITFNLVDGLGTASEGVDFDGPDYEINVQNLPDDREQTAENFAGAFSLLPGDGILQAKQIGTIVNVASAEKGEQGNAYTGTVKYDQLPDETLVFTGGVKGVMKVVVKNDQNIGGGLTPGRQPFSITFNLVDDLNNGYKVVNSTDPSAYEVDVLNDPDDRVATAQNLADGLTALNTASGTPVVQAVADNGEVTFQSMEKGEQGNYYNIEVSYDTQPDANLPFSGGAKGIQQIVVENQVATGTSIGRVPFSLTFDFIDNLSDDYEFVSGSPGNPHYKFKIQNLPDDRKQTASNLNEAINTLQWSPLTSEQVQGALEQIQLTAFEKGEHTNHYTGSVIHEMDPQGTVVSESPLSFSGGADAEPEPIRSVTLSYQNPDDFRKKAFQINITFVSDVSVDPVNGISSQAKLDRWTDQNIFEVRVRDEGGDTAKTASNFAYVFNSDLLGTASPFIAHIGPLSGSQVTLTSRELGAHTNEYLCGKNGEPFTAPGNAIGYCFTGGKDGTGKAKSIVTIPSVRQNVLAQGERNVIYARNAIGQVEWSTDDDSIVEVGQPRRESETESTASFDEVSLPSADAVPVLAGADVSATVERDDLGQITGETAEVVVRYTVTYPSVKNLTASAIVEGEEVPVTLEPFTLSGELHGDGTYTHSSGLTITNMEGTLTGAIVGYATGEYKGSVKGTVQADMSATFKVLNPAPLGTVSAAYIENEGQLTGLSIKILKAAGDITSTVKKADTSANIYEHVYAKRPGKANIIAKDDICESIMTVEVLGQRLILEMAGRDPGEAFGVGDTAQINAWVGTRGQKNEDKNVTARVEWSSGNENVATIDSTGLLTAVGPGDTNITAKFSTEDPEIGEIRSEGVLPVHVTKLTGLTIALDESMIPKLSLENKNSAFKSVLLFISSSRAAGRSITMEGQRINITLPPGADTLTEREQIGLITDDLATKLTVSRDLGGGNIQPLVRVSTVPDFPGILVLEPVNQEGDADGDGLVHETLENGIIDISTSASREEISIVPGFAGGINLPPTESYKLMVIAEYDNGITRRLPATSVAWVNTPVSHVDQSYLDTGILKFGEIAGTSTVQARFGEVTQGNVCETEQAVCSNELTVTVQSGPSIEFARILGARSIEKGSRVNILTKVSDIDTISDIKNITSSLVRSNFSTYGEINSDPDAVWFDVTAFMDETVITDSSVPSEIEGGEEEAPPAEPTALNYRTYRIPVNIPVNTDLYDGDYKLILSISDTTGHTINQVIPIRIGKAASGDVNGDGRINMIDVLLAFRIANGSVSPTPAQLAAANIDGKGGVTMIDVLLLFRQTSAS